MATGHDNQDSPEMLVPVAGARARLDSTTAPERGEAHARRTPTGVVTTLAELPERALLDERALAEALGVTKRTIRRMIGRFELPPPVRFAGRSMWQVRAILSWFEARADRKAREADLAARRLGGRL